MADYYINSDKGKEIVGSMKAGEVRDVSDGSTWIKNSDRSQEESSFVLYGGRENRLRRDHVCG